MSQIVRIKGYHVGGTDKAYLFSPVPKGTKPDQSVWIPRSQIEYRWRGADVVNGWTETYMDIPKWLADSKGLDYDEI